jgi:penicillin amidase
LIFFLTFRKISHRRMHIPVRILFAGLVLIMASHTSLPGLCAEVRDRSSSPYSGTENLKGLTDSVAVYWDERGMPHIYACNEHDLYMATGYVTARERLWHMDLVRRSASGRLAEIFGKSFFQADIFSRCLRIRESASLILEKEDPQVLSCLQAYTEGVNAWINSCEKHLPVEFRLLSYKPEPWSLEDIASIIGLMGWNLDCRNLTAELFVYQLIKKVGIEKATALIPDWRATDVFVYPGFEINDTLLAGIEMMVSSFSRISELGVSAFSSSNNWAVSGSRSQTGSPLLSNDMHLSLSSPGIWMQMHQVIPGILDVTGVLIPGEPFIIAGHNTSIAWGLTNLRVDAVDLYAEKLNPDNPDLYLFNGEWREMTKKREIIRIRGGKDDTVTLRYTHRGPVISGCMDIEHLSPKLQWLGYDYLEGLRDHEKSAISMRWSGLDESDEVGAVWLINRAEGWNDFRKGVSKFRSISQNFIYADKSGNIGITSGGGIPVRNSGSAILIRSGETDACDWKGYVPFDQMPYVFNPAAGTVSSANNKSTGEDYPWFISNSFDLPYRISRIREMLDEKEKLGIEDFCRMITDQHSDLARLMTPVILSIRGDLLSPAAISLLDTLAAWDYEMNPSLIAPTLLEFFRISFRRNLLADELGDLYDSMWGISSEHYVYRILKEGPDEWVDDITTEKMDTVEEIARRSFNDAIAALEKKYGTNPAHWQWGRMHTVTFTHPLGSVRLLGMILGLNSRKYPVGGNEHTVCPYFTYKPGFDAIYGASVRHIYNTADWDESLSVIPGGNSGVPTSEFYLSQADAFIEGRFYKDHFTREAVLSSAKYLLTLRPSPPK